MLQYEEPKSNGLSPRRDSSIANTLGGAFGVGVGVEDSVDGREEDCGLRGKVMVRKRGGLLGFVD